MAIDPVEKREPIQTAAVVLGSRVLQGNLGGGFARIPPKVDTLLAVPTPKLTVPKPSKK